MYDVASVETGGGEPCVVRLRDEAPVASSTVRRIARGRKERESFFPAGLFFDPAWDILLHLYSMELAGFKTTTSAAAVASNAPETTGHRWLRQLIQLGLCEKEADRTDARRHFVSLSRKGRTAMDEYFRSTEARAMLEALPVA